MPGTAAFPYAQQERPKKFPGEALRISRSQKQTTEAWYAGVLLPIVFDIFYGQLLSSFLLLLAWA